MINTQILINSKLLFINNARQEQTQSKIRNAQKASDCFGLFSFNKIDRAL